jgi:hypothetical protein
MDLLKDFASMKTKIATLFFVFLTISLLIACQSESIPLAAPTSRASQPAPTADLPSPTLASTGSPTAAPKPLAELINLQGAGRWRASVTSDWDVANLGQALLIENQVLTETDAKAVIEYPDGLLVHVAPKTLFTVTDLEQAEDQTLRATIQLLLGQLFVSHSGAQDSQIRIETEAGIAGVRGTMMSVKVTISGRVIVTCLEGTCTLENEHGLIVLEAGKQAELLNAATPPVYLGMIADYQLNEWFDNQPAALLAAQTSGLLAQLPAGCNLETGVCQLELACNPNSGAGCQLPGGCNALTGAGCELPGGCNPVTGQGCELPPGCDLLGGQACQLLSGCNLVNGQGCAQPLACDPLSGTGCQPAAGCDLQTGQGCELSSGCNPVTGENCNCTGAGCMEALIPGTPPAVIATAIPVLLPATIPAAGTPVVLPPLGGTPIIVPVIPDVVPVIPDVPDVIPVIPDVPDVVPVIPDVPDVVPVIPDVPDVIPVIPFPF